MLRSLVHSKNRLRRFFSSRAAAWARRRQGADVPPVTLQSRRVYILPTTGGVAFAAMLVVMSIAGVNYGNSLALFLTFLLAGFALVSMHQCHRNLLRTVLISATAIPTFARTPGILRVTLQNDAKFHRYAIEITPPDGNTASCGILSHGQVQIEAPIEAPTRGIVRLERFKVSSTFPFGLFRAWSWVHIPLEMVVYPRPNGTLPMPADAGAKAGSLSRAHSGSDEWLGLRPFRDGDSPRQVAWKAYARGAPLLVKEYSAMGAELRLFDFRRLGHLAVEARLEQLARWIVDAETHGERYGLVIPPHEVEPDSGPQHRHQCLTALAAYGIDRASNDG